MLVKVGMVFLSLIFSVQLFANTSVVFDNTDPAPFPWSQCLMQPDILLGVWGYDVEESQNKKFILISNTKKGFWLDITIIDSNNKLMAEGIGLMLNDNMSLFSRLSTPDGIPIDLTITSYCDKSGSRKLMNARVEFFDKFNSALDYTLHRVK